MRQGQTLSAPLADVLGGEKGVEDAVADFVGNAGARIFHADFRPGAVAARADDDLAFAVGSVRQASATACAALTTRLTTTRLMSEGRQETGGKSAAKSVTTSATSFHSLRQRVMPPRRRG